MNVKRTIAYYEKKGEKFLGEYFIESTVDTLKEIVSAYSDDPELYMIYPLLFEHKRIIRELFGIEMDVKNYDYFLECLQA